MGRPIASSDPCITAFIKALGLNLTGLCSVKLIIESREIVTIEALYEAQDSGIDGLTYEMKRFGLVEIDEHGNPREQDQAEDQGVVQGQSARPLPDKP